MNFYPAILTESERELQAYLDVCQPMVPVETVQIDLIDGSFAENLTVSPLDLVNIDWGRLQIDIHLMVDEPMDFVHELVAVKEQLPVRAVIAQIEKMSFQADFVEETKKHGWKTGLSLDIFTPLEEIEAGSWRDLDVLQLMGIEAGSQGQELKPYLFEKLQEAHQLIEAQDHEIELIVDGGVKLDNFHHLLEQGADSLAVGSALWTAQDIPGTVLAFTK